MMNMTTILSEFQKVLPAAKRSSAGWMNFNCPMCNDKRGRGGFLETHTGGFRYRCFNAGCDANSSPIGWEPGSGLGGRPRKLFVFLGGNVKSLPIDFLLKKSDTYSRTGGLLARGENTAVFNFDEVELPSGSIPLHDCIDVSAGLVVGYIMNLGKEIAMAQDYFWTPYMPSYLIIPYYHRKRIVGWLARNCGDIGRRFLGKCHADFVFRQDTLEKGSSRSVIVVEGVMNAIAINGVAIRNATLTKKQEALLEVSGQDVIMLPDQDVTGMSFIDVAEKRGWRVSVPDWDVGVKDVVDATRRYGMLYTIRSVVSGATKNYLKARTTINIRGSKKNG